MPPRVEKSKRCGVELKSLSQADASSLFELVQRNSDHLTALGDYADVVAMSREETERQLSAIPESSLAMGIYLDQKLIGRVDLNSPKPRTYVLGYWIDCDHTGQGFTTDACRAIVECARKHHEATEIWAGVKELNLPSIAVLEKLGFELVEKLPTHLRFCLILGDH